MASADRPFSAVLHDIAGNVQDIVHAELRLAKSELSEELGKSVAVAVLMGAGLLMLAFSLLFVLAALFFALSTQMPSWAAALWIALGQGIIAAVCVALAVKRLRMIRALPKTVADLKENVAWAQRLTR